MGDALFGTDRAAKTSQVIFEPCRGRRAAPGGPSFLVPAMCRCVRRRLAVAAAPVIMALTWKSPSAGSLPLPKGCLIKEDWPHARPWSQMCRSDRTEERFLFISLGSCAIGALTRCFSMPLRLTNTLRRVGGGAFARVSRRALFRVRGRLL